MIRDRSASHPLTMGPSGSPALLAPITFQILKSLKVIRSETCFKTLNPILVPIEEAFYDVDTPDDFKSFLENKTFPYGNHEG